MKLIKQSKLLTFQIIVCLIILNTQVSFAQSKFDGSYIGAKLGSAKGSADSNEVAGATYNGGINVGQYSPNGNIFGIYGGYNTSFNKEYFLGFEAGLNRLEIKTENQLFQPIPFLNFEFFDQRWQSITQRPTSTRFRGMSWLR